MSVLKAVVNSGSGGGVTSVSGTTNRITSSGGTTPSIDISNAYVGQTSITTLGAVGTGTWQGTIIGLAYGGTNANLSATGGTSNVLKQVSSGAAITVGQLAVSDLSTPTMGTGSIVLANTPTLITPLLGTPTSGVLTNCTGTASGLTAGTVTTNANLTGPVTSVGNATTLISAIAFSMPTVANTTGNNIALDAYALFGYTINEIYGLATSSGTCTVAIQIGGTNVTSLSSLSVTATPQNVAATGANIVSATNRVSLVITSNSSGANLEFTLKITRT